MAFHSFPSPFRCSFQPLRAWPLPCLLPCHWDQVSLAFASLVSFPLAALAAFHRYSMCFLLIMRNEKAIKIIHSAWAKSIWNVYDTWSSAIYPKLLIFHALFPWEVLNVLWKWRAFWGGKFKRNYSLLRVSSRYSAYFASASTSEYLFRENWKVSWIMHEFTLVSWGFSIYNILPS